jgi:hypothetical protein
LQTRSAGLGPLLHYQLVDIVSDRLFFEAQSLPPVAIEIITSLAVTLLDFRQRMPVAAVASADKA